MEKNNPTNNPVNTHELIITKFLKSKSNKTFRIVLKWNGNILFIEDNTMDIDMCFLCFFINQHCPFKIININQLLQWGECFELF